MPKIKKIMIFILLNILIIKVTAQTIVEPIRVDLPLKDCVSPIYPSTSIERDEEGKVEVLFKVSESGIVSDAIVKKSSGFKDLDDAAITALKFCKFNVSDVIKDQGSIISTGTFNFNIDKNTNKKKIENNFIAASRLIWDKSCDNIKYPSFFFSTKKQGTTKLSFTVGVDGVARNPQVKVSSGSDILDNASKEIYKNVNSPPQQLMVLRLKVLLKLISNG